jgi:hypothetical protein
MFSFDIICSSVLCVEKKLNVKMAVIVNIGVGLTEGDSSNVKICDVLIVKCPASLSCTTDL